MATFGPDVDPEEAQWMNIENQWGQMMGQRPGYTSGFNPNRLLEGEMDRRLGGINLNTQGLERFRSDATRRGPSPWARLQNQSLSQQELGQREGAYQQAGTQAAEARGQLAMRGGLSSGARERLARDASRGAMAMSQNIGRDAMAARMQTGIQDEQNRMAQLAQLPGMELQALQPEFQKTQLWGQARQADAKAMADESERINEFQMNLWKELMADIQGQREAWAQRYA